MQTTATTRSFDPRQIKRAMLALALATSLTAVATAFVVSDGGPSDTDGAAGSIAVTTGHSRFDYRALEMNLQLPTGSFMPAAGEPIEPTDVAPNVGRPAGSLRSAGIRDFRFLEMNLDLPGSSVSTAAHWKVIEENSWGEDFDFDSPDNGSLFPSVDDVPQIRPGQVIY